MGGTGVTANLALAYIATYTRVYSNPIRLASMTMPRITDFYIAAIIFNIPHRQVHHATLIHCTRKAVE